MHIKGKKNVIADAFSQLDANFNEKLPTEPTNDSMTYIFLPNTDIKETDFPLSPTFNQYVSAIGQRTQTKKYEN
jgi:hypothetical protein